MSRTVKVGEVRYRIVCAHGTHWWCFPSRQVAEDRRAHYDTIRGQCAPWTVQARAVSEWGDPDAAEMCLYAMGKTVEGRLL